MMRTRPIFLRVLPFVLVAALSSLCAVAQNSTMRIYTDPPGARFIVDGQTYTSSTNFQWPAGSTHVVSFPMDAPAPGSTSVTGTQTSDIARYTFKGWMDSNGLLLPNSAPVQVITADPSFTELKGQVDVAWRVYLTLFDLPGDPLSQTPQCGGAPGNLPPAELRVGIVYIDSQCFWNNPRPALYVSPGIHKMNAIPFPGFVFTGWSVNGTQALPSMRTIDIEAPVTISPVFVSAKRVRFLTNPLGLNVAVDGTASQTLPQTALSGGPCPQNLLSPVASPLGVGTMCAGDFDFAPGSTHIIGGVSPQLDTNGRVWVFSSWTNGMGDKAKYVTNNDVVNSDVLTATYVPGATVSFLTSPAGLKLNVDGRDDWPNLNFVWGVGTQHQVLAPAQQLDRRGRGYVLRGWSNNGAAGQTITVDQAAFDNGMRMTASYDLLSRITVQTTPAGAKVQVDGADCLTPCTIDRPSGSQVHISSPASINPSDGVRLNLADGAFDRTLTFNADTQVISIPYQASYRLSGGSDPKDAIALKFDPPSPDGYYPAGSTVTITAAAGQGFKFRRWTGDVTGLSSTITVLMNRPRTVIATTEKVPYVPPAVTRNAAGETPGNTVAPGSLISIFGANLASDLVLGPASPLSQSLAGVTVQVADRILPLVFVSPQQINAQLPSDLPEGDYSLRIQSPTTPDVTGTFTVTRNAPGLFSTDKDGNKMAVALHEDGSPITAGSPARHGETISLFGTGFGPYERKPMDGFAATPDNPNPLSDTVEANIGGIALTPAWGGTASGYVGLTVIRVKLTDDVPGGVPAQILVKVNGQTSNTVLLPME